MATLKVPDQVVDPDVDAEALRKACQGWGTDEKGIIAVIGHRNADQRKKIREAYQAKYNEDLIQRFEKELSRNFERAAYRWMLEPYDREAVLFHVALKEKKKSYPAIIELCCLPHSDELLEIKRAYQSRYKQTLEESITAQYTGDMRNLMLLLVSVQRFESDNTDVKLAEKEAEILHECIKKKEFNKEEVTRIMTTRNKTQLIATFYQYKHAYGTPIAKSLVADNKGNDYVCALHTLTKCIKAPHKYLERVLSDTIYKRGADDDDLTRVVVTRAEKDLGQIKDLFHKKNGMSLEDAVKKETSGDYQNFILTLLGAKDD